MRFAIPALWAVLIAEAGAIWWLRAPWLTTDAALYMELARNLSGPGFVSQSPDGLLPEAMRSPGYPLFLNLLIVRLGLTVGGVVAIHMVLYLASIWLIAYKVIRDPLHRLAFLVVAVVYVFPFFYAATLLSEGLAIFIVALITAIISVRWRQPVAQMVLAGALVGIGSLVRTDLLPVMGAILAVCWWRDRSKPAQALTTCFAAAAAAGLILLPYMTWNQRTFGHFSPVPVASTIGQSLYLATWESIPLADRVVINGEPPTAGSYRVGLPAKLARIYQEARERASEVDVARRYPQRQLEVAQQQAFRAAAIDRIRERPSFMLAHTLNGMWRLMNTGEYAGVPRLAVYGLTAVSFVIFLAAVAGAFLTLVRRSRPVSAAPLLVWLAVQIPHLPLHTEARYTASIRLIVMMYAALAFTWLAGVPWQRSPAGEDA